jgi:hypothetical protein
MIIIQLLSFKELMPGAPHGLFGERAHLNIEVQQCLGSKLKRDGQIASMQ